MAQNSAAKIKIDGISQVAIAVNNLEEVAENFWKIMGIGPWMIFNWEAPLVYDRKYKGAFSEASEKIAITQVGDCWLELVQPVEGASIYKDWLDEQELYWKPLIFSGSISNKRSTVSLRILSNCRALLFGSRIVGTSSNLYGCSSENLGFRSKSS